MSPNIRETCLTIKSTDLDIWDLISMAPLPPFQRREGVLLCCCLSVGLSIGPSAVSVHFFALVAHTEMKFGIQIIIRISSDLMKQFLTELCPLDFEKFQ
jgi:hypothetical protein